ASASSTSGSILMRLATIPYSLQTRRLAAWPLSYACAATMTAVARRISPTRRLGHPARQPCRAAGPKAVSDARWPSPATAGLELEGSGPPDAAAWFPQCALVQDHGIRRPFFASAAAVISGLRRAELGITSVGPCAASLIRRDSGIGLT